MGGVSHQQVLGSYHLPLLIEEKSDWLFESDRRSSIDLLLTPLFSQCQWVVSGVEGCGRSTCVKLYIWCVTLTSDRTWRLNLLCPVLSTNKTFIKNGLKLGLLARDFVCLYKYTTEGCLK